MVDLTWILDPEIVIPSAEAAAGPVFWERMLARADDHRPRIGPETMRALGELADHPPQNALLADRDFWKIIGLYMSRGFRGQPSARPVCEMHLNIDYMPDLGPMTNLQVLIDDLQSVGLGNRIVISSTVECWAPRDGQCTMCEAAKLHTVHAATNSSTAASTVAIAWRQGYLDEHPSSVRNIPALSTEMFPALEFHPGAWDRLGSLVGPEEENGPKLIHNLGVLNDSASRIWNKFTTRDERQAAMASLGLTCSPESPQTHRNAAAMSERDFIFDGIPVRCEWHAKLRPNANRIYFNVGGGKVRVGAIVNHLST